MPMSLALSICELFISLMQLANGVQFFIIIFFLLFSASAVATTVFRTVKVAFTSIYASLELHKIGLNIEVLNLIWLLTLYVPHDS